MAHSRNSLLAALIATAAIVSVALIGAGWKLVELQLNQADLKVGPYLALDAAEVDV